MVIVEPPPSDCQYKKASTPKPKRKVTVPPERRSGFESGDEQRRNREMFEQFCRQLRHYMATIASTTQAKFLLSIWYPIEIHIRESFERLGIFPRGGAR